jgi:hypothetical protein
MNNASGGKPGIQEVRIMQEAVLKIQEIGAPPEGFTDIENIPPDEILDLWDAYEDAVISIIQPVTWEEAEILITCCPTDRMAGIEWSLLHCIESCIPGNDFEKNPQVMEKYKNLINTCNSDMMKEMLYMRLGSQ